MGDEADSERAEMDAVIAEVRRGFAGGFPRVPEAEAWLAGFQQTKDRSDNTMSTLEMADRGGIASWWLYRCCQRLAHV